MLAPGHGECQTTIVMCDYFTQCEQFCVVHNAGMLEYNGGNAL